MESVSNDVSGVDAEEVGNYLSSFSLADQNQEEFVTSALPHAKRGESEDRMKEEEALVIELSPNLRTMKQAEGINAKIKEAEAKLSRLDYTGNDYLVLDELFQLNVDLFKTQVHLLEDRGILPQDFVEKVKEFMDDKSKEVSFQEPNKQLKSEAFSTFIMLILLANWLQIPAVKTQSIYGNHYFELYKLEEDLGWIIDGALHLTMQHQVHKQIFDNIMEKAQFSKIDLERGITFVTIAVFNGYQQILPYLEGKGYYENQTVLQRILGWCFTKNLLEYVDFSLIGEKKDPLITFFPFLVKYGSLDKIEDYFNDRFKNLSGWEKAYKWIDLHCQAAEILASRNPEKAISYLDKAKEEVRDKLWTTFFTSNKSQWDEKYKIAMERIAQVRNQLTGSSASI
ncbi:MAG: hypothetical protein K1060chlam2_01497 [Chlamydiae bacterium]|nr:hypothetical protein [Chlamydiota bacterium]